MENIFFCHKYTSTISKYWSIILFVIHSHFTNFFSSFLSFIVIVYPSILYRQIGKSIGFHVCTSFLDFSQIRKSGMTKNKTNYRNKYKKSTKKNLPFINSAFWIDEQSFRKYTLTFQGCLFIIQQYVINGESFSDWMKFKWIIRHFYFQHFDENILF